MTELINKVKGYEVHLPQNCTKSKIEEEIIKETLDNINTVQ